MKNPKQNPSPVKFMFAWSDYRYGKLTFHAVSETLQIFSSMDWAAFHKKTGLFTQRLRNYADGFLTKDDTARIHTHERYLFNFIIKGSKIELVGADEVTAYDPDTTPENDYFGGVINSNERNSH